MDHKGLTHWKTESLEKSMDAIIDYRGKTPKKKNLGIPLITAKIVKNGVIEQPSEFIAVADYDSWMVRGLPEVGDVVITTEAPLGEVAQLASKNVALAQRIVTLRGKKDFLHNDFLLYLLQSNNIQRQLESRSSGSTVKGIKQKELRKIELLIPPYQEQISISNILKKLDQKIELNRQINQTLEAMAQALFKSWFVDFDPVKAKLAAKAAGADAEGVTLAAMEALSGQNAEALRKLAHTEPERYAELKATAALFPEALVESELGEIPAGWEVSQVRDFGKIICGKTPSKKVQDYYGSSIPFLKIPDMHNKVYAVETNDKLSDQGSLSQSNKLIPKNSICVSCIATVGLVTIAPSDCHTNQQINSILPHLQSYVEFLYLSMKNLTNHLRDLASGGSATLNLNTSNFSKIILLKPKSEILCEFSDLLRPLFNEILSNEKSAFNLANIRDTLLPKLLSGEISVDDVELPSLDEQVPSHD